MKCMRWIAAVLLGLWMSALSAWAQPANNSFGSRILIAGATNLVTGSNVGANSESGEPYHAGFRPRVTVWWKWVAPQSGAMRFSTLGSSFNTVLAVYTGTAVGSLTSIAANDNISATVNASAVTFWAEAGTEYQIVVDGRQSVTGSIQLSGYMIPTATLTEPDPGARFKAGTPIPISAEASASVGGVAKVDFYAGPTKLGTALSAPYAMVWTNAAPGAYSLRALVTDVPGQTNTSDAVSITVMPANYVYTTLAASNSVWRYLDNGSDQGTGWTAVDFDDGAWAAGPAELGYGDGGEGTVVGFGPETTNKFITTYFRQSFVVQDAFALTNLVVSMRRDDGAVVYLNGTAIWTNNMPAGPIDYLTAGSNAGDDGQTWWTTNASGRLLVEGTNVLAVEIHQDSATSSDISFALQLDAEGFQSTNVAPTISLSAPAAGAFFGVGANVTLTAAVSGANPVTNVVFYADGAWLGADVSSPYSLVYSSVPIGTHVLWAAAWDGAGLSSTSAPVTITVTNVPLAVRLTAPANLAVLTAPTNVTVTAVAAGTNTISAVEFHTNGVLYATDTASPYTQVWTNAPVGSNWLFAVVRDSSAARATSAVVSVTVRTNGPPSVALTSPLNNASVNGPATITLRATATDLEGTVARVEFYVNGAKLGESTVSPYTYAWTNVSLGAYTLNVAATDNAGLAATSAPVSIVVVEAVGSQWTAYNDHQRGTGTASNVTVYSMGTGGVVVGGPLTNFATGQLIGPGGAGLQISSVGTVNGVTGSSTAPYAGTPADTLFASKVDWLNSALYFAPSPYDAAVIFTFTNLAPGRKYGFRGAAVRGNSYPGRWTLATLVDATSATPAHILGTGTPASPGIVTNGWSPYGSGLAPMTQAAWNSGENRCGDVIGWDEIVPAGTSFSVICSNYLAVTTTSPSGTMDNYCYAFSAMRLEEFAASTFLVAITNPMAGQVFQAPVDLHIDARVSGAQTVSNIEFYAGSLLLGQSGAVPYGIVWTNAFEGANALRAVAMDASGARATSAVVSVVITPSPTNLADPVIGSVVPAAGVVNNILTNVQVAFSEPVSGVNASDLRINGAAALQVSGSGGVYMFTFAQPAYGEVRFTWAADAGIQDTGTPPLAFDPARAGNLWSYTLVDTLAPAVLTRIPAAGASITNLTQVQVVFSEPVVNVDAADLLVSGSPAVGLSGSGASYVFSFSQPLPGTVSLAWATGHGIADLSGNAFAGAGWQCTLEMPRVTLVASNSLWAFVKGTQEASAPVDAWRAVAYDSSGWSNALAPFYYGDTGYTNPSNPGTVLSDMLGVYSGIYMRNAFYVESPGALTNLVLTARSDDGFVAWINGVEVVRYNLGATDPFDGGTPASSPEPTGNGAAFISYSLADLQSYITAGTNVLAVHAFNQSLSSSTDFGMDLELAASLFDVGALPPRITSVTPAAGVVYALTNITVRFSREVVNVDASDLLVNGVAASSVSGSSNQFTFAFGSPAFGPVAVAWAAGHGIADLADPPHTFDAQAAGASWSYTLFNAAAPAVVSQTPAAGLVVSNLTAMQVVFSKPVAGLDAADLLVNGAPATGLTGAGAVWNFAFPQPAYGPVGISWRAAHGITDTESPANAFEPARPGATWSLTLVDLAPPVVVERIPAAGVNVTNLTELTVRFSEAVAGVGASDLLVNGQPASGVSGSGDTYAFTFAQPNATTIQITWSTDHGIRDLAAQPNGFDASAAGAAWSYRTLDTVAPVLLSVTPPPGATVRDLTQIRLLFSEPVAGVEPGSFLINDAPVTGGAGSDAGPYVFTFAQPPTGEVRVAWAPGHGITDLALPPNSFAGSGWSYILDTNAQVDKNILISEIMFHPSTEQVRDEWIELHNTGDSPVNLTGWQLARGVNYVFGPCTIPAGGFVVVAADTNAFKARYPGVDNVVGNWDGQLSNAGETLELVNAQGGTVDTVKFTDSGDWGQRVQGDGEMRALRVTRSGATATVTVGSANWQNGDRVTISGADQPEYNVTNAVIAGSSRTSFTYPVSGTPATPATGMVIVRQTTDYTRVGWAWSCRADGLGASFELVNPALPNQHGQNWDSSHVLDGTPGASNSVATTNSAPLILETSHYPLIPKSNDTVTVSARLLDEQTQGVSGTLFWRVDLASGTPAFTSAALYDDGLHNDGVAGDGVFAAQIPPQTNNTVVEFYIQAWDAAGSTRTWPAPSLMTNGVYAQGANALYQVDDPNLAYVGTVPQPAYRLIMRWADRNELATYPGNGTWRSSNARMHGAFASVDTAGTEFRYLTGFRNRGAGTRSANPPNYKASFASDQPFTGAGAINLNSQYTFNQYAGYVLSSLSGLHCESATPVRLSVNNVNRANSGASQYGSYVRLESTDRDYPANHFGLDAGGNLYRGQSGGHQCNLNYLGTNWVSYAAAGYSKQSNKSDNDWSDLIDLCNVLNNTPASNYSAVVRAHVNVEEWMTFFAVFHVMLSRETSIATGQGDDYSFYRGALDTRFQLLAHDFDTILNQGDTTGGYTDSIFRMTAMAAWLDRFMKYPEFVPIYYRELKRLSDTVFAPVNLYRTLDQTLQGYVPQATIEAMKAFGSNRVSYILSVIPTNLTVTVPLAQSGGFYMTNAASATLYGASDIINTRSVRVNGAAAVWSAWEGRWTNTVVLLPGLNRVLVQSFNADGGELQRQAVEIWYDNSGGTTVPAGTLSANTTWLAASGPYRVSGTLTVASGATLTIQPGASVYFASAASLVVANGGRLLAEGTESAPIHFTRAPGTTIAWGGITINGGAGSPETRIVYAHIENNSATAVHSTSGTLVLDHVTFGTTAYQYVSLDSSSFVVSDCYFPAPTGSFEPAHGTGGVKAGGRGIFIRNFFGAPTGYNDVIDFTGGNRPGSPIVQFYDNVFAGSGDDILDLDGTDAWVEGNIFMHAHKNGSPDSSSAVSGGDDSGQTSEVTIIGNLIYDCDQAAMAKLGDWFNLFNNTIVHQTHTGGTDTAGAVVCMADEGIAEGAGMYLEGNIVFDAEALVRNQTASRVVWTNNILPLAWTGPGGANSITNPLFKRVPLLAETTFTNWAQAQVMKDWLSLSTASPALRAGPNGRDLGGVVPMGVSISGEPEGVTRQTTATLRVGSVWSGNGIPVAGWPNGSGYTHYRWRLDGGSWSAETPTTTPIALSGLSNGRHAVEVAGKRDSGLYQDDASLGADASVTRSRTWTVQTSGTALRLNEVLAVNTHSFVHAGATPDLIELFNASDEAFSLAGVMLTDDPLQPDKFVFPEGATMAPWEYLVVYAQNSDGSAGYHTGFNLSQEGEALYLYDSWERGGALLDSLVFGLQAADYSIGRVADGTWTLCEPTFGGPNHAASTGDPMRLRFNEWMTAELSTAPSDFVELYNPDTAPVVLGGLYLTDNVAGWPTQHVVAPLSYIAPRGFSLFMADAAPQLGAAHLDFRLDYSRGMLGLLTADQRLIDQGIYGIQSTDVSQGRSPDGASNLVFFSVPTPGAPNPANSGSGGWATNIVTTNFSLLPSAFTWRYNETSDLTGVAWYATNYDDSAWAAGLGGFAYDWNNATLAGYTNTGLSDPTTVAAGLVAPRVYFFRTRFVITNDLAGFNLDASLRADDGTVLYVNGQEALRVRMNAGSYTYASLATASPTGGDTAGDEVFTLPGSLFVRGTNYLAAVVFQNSGTSSDAVWGMSLAASRSTTNITGSSIVINEVLANNLTLREPDGSTPDWIELYNAAGAQVDLADYSLTDSVTAPRRFVFPAGATVPALGFARVFCDASLPASLTNTGFGLKSTGGALYLYDKPANGGALLGSLLYGLQAPDFSLGRVPNGAGAWTLTIPTPAAPNFAAQLGNISAVRINEWMASPGKGDDWFELWNPNAQPVALGGLYLTDDLANRTKNKIPALSFLGVSTNGYQRFWADNNTAAGADHANFKLDGGTGEALGLYTAGGALIDGVGFGPQLSGVSEGRFPDGATVIARFPGAESPGEANYQILTHIVFNEVLAHTDPPLEDAVELANLSAEPVNVGGWFLSDDRTLPRKFRIPDGVVLPAGGFTVLYESQFNADPTNNPVGSFALSSANGEDLVLSGALADGTLTGWRALVKFGASVNGASFGRYVTSDGREEFVTLAARTFGKDDPGSLAEFRTGTGASNAYPRVGPVVISEIMYHPPDLGTNDNALDEYIELLNISAAPVALYDTAFPSNTWRLRDAVSLDLPAGIVLPAGGRLLVVNFNPSPALTNAAFFRAKYHVGEEVILVGPYSGKLANSEGKVELYLPDSPNVGDVPYVLVERVHYHDSAPWPPAADGTGVSLNRVSGPAFGDDPANWFAAAPSPGYPVNPVVVRSPASQQIAAGGSAAFDVLAGGAPPLFYQWRLNGAVLPGETGSGLALASVQAVQAGAYDVVVSNVYGSVTSAPAMLALAAGATDTDGDGIPDAWMMEMFGHPTGLASDSSLASQDADGDGATNLQEYRAGTAPRDPASVLRLTEAGLLNGQLVFTFEALSNRAYSVLRSPGVVAPGTNVLSLAPAPTNRLMQFQAPAGNDAGFFRLRTP